MPQFDFYSFSIQTFTVLIGFSFFYIFVLQNFLNQIASVFKIRSKFLKSTSSVKLFNLYSSTFFI